MSERLPPDGGFEAEFDALLDRQTEAELAELLKAFEFQDEIRFETGLAKIKLELWATPASRLAMEADLNKGRAHFSTIAKAMAVHSAVLRLRKAKGID